jgi:hypothetical protein
MLAQSSTELMPTTVRPSEVVVSNLTLHSKLFLQDAHTNRFFQGIDRWTTQADRALVFYDVNEALYICRWLGLRDIRIVSDFDNVDNEDALRAVA